VWVAVAREKDLQPRRACVVRAGGIDLALVCSDGGVFAIDNVCPHSGGSLGDGSVQGDVVTCPLHGWQFECSSGRSLTEARPAQATFPVRLESGQVFVEVPEPLARPAAEAADPASRKSAVELWKAKKHGLDVWPDVQRYAAERTPMARIEEADLERMKWYGFFYRKNNDNDRYMIRVRIPGCEMSSDQARALATVAHRSGYGIVDLTTRGNVQIQGLTIDALPAVRATLERAGLTARQSGHDNVRNVTSHPWSGIDPLELIDTRELARALQAMVIGSRELSDLPRKVNVALTGRAEAPPHAWSQDISYVAARGPDESIGFHLLLGGNQGQAPKLAWHIPVFVRPEQVLGVSDAVLRTFRELGHRHDRQHVRLRYLIERLGPDGLLLELERRLGYELQRFPKAPPRASAEESFVGWFAQKQKGVLALGVCVPVGRLTADELEGLSVVARQFGTGVLRTTYDQNLIIPGIAASERAEAGYAVARHGLSFEPDPATRSMVACTGKQFCNIAIVETKGYAYRLIEELRRRRVQLHGIRIAMSGCPSSCANGFTADVGLKGLKIRRGLRVVDAFDVFLGGGIGDELRMGTLYQKAVPFDQLSDALEKVVAEFHLGRSRGESFSSYWQRKLHGHRAEPLRAEVPRWQCSRCGHPHVAQDPPPFCPVCAALRAKFVPAPEEGEAPAAAAAPPAEPPKAAVPAGRRVLIVGGGIAGHVAAQTLRALDAGARVTLVSDEPRFYNRLNLTRVLAQELPREALFDYAPSWYDEQRVELLSGARVISLDPIKKLALLAEGRELEYDACILAPGSSASVPTFFREGLPGLVVLRTLADVDGIAAAIGTETRVAVVGGGVLGLEAAYGAAKRGAHVRILEYLPRLMPRQLDGPAAGLLERRAREQQIEVETGVSIEEVLGEARAEGLRLRDGRVVGADLIVVSTGIRPNTDWIKRSGIRCGRGVIVDDRMATSAPDVYAAGDVAEWRGEIAGLWANAMEQAKVAAANVAGKPALYEGCVPLTVLKCLPYAVTSIGEVPEDGGEVSSHRSDDAQAGVYRRVVCRRGIPIGALLVGTSSGIGELRQLVEGGRELSRLRDRVLPEEATAHA
jgi:ferredoxin-nitrite reductase